MQPDTKSTDYSEFGHGRHSRGLSGLDSVIVALRGPVEEIVSPGSWSLTRSTPGRRFSRYRGRRALAGLVLTFLVGVRTAAGELSYGPLAHEFEMTLEPGKRLEIAGPIFSADHSREWRRWTLSPFLRYARNRSIDSVEFDLAYPLITYDQSGGEYKLKFFYFTSFAGGRDQEDHGIKRFTIFPLLFWQRSPVPEDCYTALFPIHGRVKNRLNRDEFWFTAWPLYIGSRRKDVVTHNVLYPLFHVRRGEGLKGWQVWPLYGSEHKAVTWRTNDFGDVELVPGHRKSFALWPIRFSQDLGLGTTNVETHRMLLPFYSYSKSPARDTRTWLWPFFSVIDNREKGYREWQMPFPFVTFTRGPGETTDRILPFYSYSRSPVAESGFLLWPLYKMNRIKSEPLFRERNRVFFFLYSNVRETNSLRQTVARRVDFWPLFAYRRDHEGRKYFQAPALLESFLPLNRATDHVYSPVWSIWRQASNPETGAASQSLLWNLYRRDRSPEATKVSLLFGLFQYHSTPERRRVKLFFIPLNRGAPQPDPADEPGPS